MAEPKVGTNTGNAGKGRPKGSLNKTTTKLKEAILLAAESAGTKLIEGDESGLTAYLRQQAKDNPNSFMALVGRVLPYTVAGDDENPITQITRIELVAATADDLADDED